MSEVGEIPKRTIRGGDYWSYTLKITDKVSGNPVDLTTEGWSGWKAQWRPASGSSQRVNITVDDSQASSGQIGLSMTADDTRNMGSDGIWDLQANDINNRPITWVEQYVNWKLGVTR